MKVLGLKKEIPLIKQKWATISPAQPTYAPAPQMEEPVVDPALAAAPAEIPIAKAESVARELGKAIPLW